MSTYGYAERVKDRSIKYPLKTLYPPEKQLVSGIIPSSLIKQLSYPPVCCHSS